MYKLDQLQSSHTCRNKCVTVGFKVRLLTYLSFLVYPFHGSGGEEREDESKGANEVTREMVNQRELLKHNSWVVEAHQQDDCKCGGNKDGVTVRLGS